MTGNINALILLTIFLDRFTSQSLLINGRGRFNCALLDFSVCNATTPECVPYPLTAVPGQTYRLKDWQLVFTVSYGLWDRGNEFPPHQQASIPCACLQKSRRILTRRDALDLPCRAIYDCGWSRWELCWAVWNNKPIGVSYIIWRDYKISSIKGLTWL